MEGGEGGGEREGGGHVGEGRNDCPKITSGTFIDHRIAKSYIIICSSNSCNGNLCIVIYVTA